MHWTQKIHIVHPIPAYKTLKAAHHTTYIRTHTHIHNDGKYAIHIIRTTKDFFSSVWRQHAEHISLCVSREWNGSDDRECRDQTKMNKEKWIFMMTMAPYKTIFFFSKGKKMKIFLFYVSVYFSFSNVRAFTIVVRKIKSNSIFEYFEMCKLEMGIDFDTFDTH